MSASQHEWIEALASMRAAGRPCALVTVTGVRGSAPREVGARMIVSEGRLAWGTIGGGNLELLGIERATALVARSEPAAESEVFPLSEKAGQCCGGEVTLLFESFPWRRPTVVIFGAGHVGQALAGLAPWMGAEVRVIDPRLEEELAPCPPVDRPWSLDLVDAPAEELDSIPEDSLVVIMTHSHALDMELVERALIGRSFPYVGLIGSERKWARFRARLEHRGVQSGLLERVTCPIGLGRTSKEPQAIAVSVAAQLLEVIARLGQPG